MNKKELYDFVMYVIAYEETSLEDLGLDWDEYVSHRELLRATLNSFRHTDGGNEDAFIRYIIVLNTFLPRGAKHWDW